MEIFHSLLRVIADSKVAALTRTVIRRWSPLYNSAVVALQLHLAVLKPAGIRSVSVVTWMICRRDEPTYIAT
ncbi:MAG: hypothetical protein LBI79_00985 [Nitrososphaerota archaeon]|nr:hypothetical protein [Nitrososphaerota archaeon]